MSDTHIPVRPNDEDAHSHHHAVLHQRVLEAKGLIIAGKNILVSSTGDAYKIDAIVPPAAPGGGLNFVGEIDLTGATSYKVNDFGFISSGNNMGAYICNQTTDALSNPPWTGTPYWSMWPNSSGQYM